jgi:hypothetical protein
MPGEGLSLSGMTDLSGFETPTGNAGGMGLVVFPVCIGPVALLGRRVRKASKRDSDVCDRRFLIFHASAS